MQNIKRVFHAFYRGTGSRSLESSQLLARPCLSLVTSPLRLVTSQAEERLEPSQASSLLDIGIRKIFSEEHDLLRENVRRFYQQEVIPYHDQWEKDGYVSRELWKKAGANQMLGVTCPAELGGPGGDWLSSIILTEEQIYSNCTGPGFSMHSDIVMPYIFRYGNKQQIARYLPRMLEGSAIAGIAMTEPDAGSDLQGIRTNAKKDGSDWILNGNKTYITNGYLSDLLIVVASTNADAKSPAHGISLFLVEAGLPGFTKGQPLKKIGFNANDTCELFFEDVRLPADALLGELNRGFYYLMHELPRERLIVASFAISQAEAMFEMTRSYVKQRKAFGKTIADLQVVQHRLAEMKTEICIARNFIDHCYTLHKPDKYIDSQTASMAKYWCSELQNRVAYQCVQLHGGFGYMWESEIAKAFCDARVAPIFAGSNEIMKELIARSIVADK